MVAWYCMIEHASRHLCETLHDDIHVDDQSGCVLGRGVECERTVENRIRFCEKNSYTHRTTLFRQPLCVVVARVIIPRTLPPHLRSDPIPEHRSSQ